MKRKFIVLDEDDSGEEGYRPFIGNISNNSPPHRLATPPLRDSSRTLSPEPRRVFKGHSSPVCLPFGNKVIDTDSRSLREAHEAVPAISASLRAHVPNASIRHNGTIPKSMERKKIANACELINLDDEVIKSHHQNFQEGEVIVIDVEELELELANEIFEIRDHDATDPDYVKLYSRNPPIKEPLRKLDMARSQRGEYLLPGYTVELRDGRFLEIATIVENIETKVVHLRGWELKRTKDFGGELKFNYNEVCYIFEIDLDDSRSIREQSVIEIGMNRVKKIRNLVRTNYHFPAFRFNIDELPEGTQQERQRYVESKGALVARWQYITTFRTAKERHQQVKHPAHYQSRKFLRLEEKECDENCYLPLYALRYQWRGDAASATLRQSGATKKSERAGAFRTNAVIACPNSHADIICLDDSDEEISIQGQKAPHSTTTPALIHVTSSDFMDVDPRTFMGNIRRRFEASLKLRLNDIRSIGSAAEPPRASTSKPTTKRADMINENQTKTYRTTEVTDGHQYSYADAFCGAGGATSGAAMAGLRILWGLDFNANAAQTWRHNFPQGQMFEKWADEVCRMPDPEGKLIVDVLHLSPPCQIWSPAHTVAGKDDDMNFASLYAVQELIAKAKPRMVTLEQTFGIIHDRFRRPFNSLIRMFTDHNFSVSWQILELERLGLPQRRKRLIIVAAAPGETLPPIPSYTHSRDGSNGMKPFQSARSALSSIPRNAANHMVLVHSSSDYLPWDDSTIIPNCITTGGANGRGHPSGRRGLTSREVASLQTFPHGHVFKGQGIRKQIGNAVPPLIAKILFSEVKRHLEQVDAKERRTSQEQGAKRTR